jgi:acetate kinase
VTGVLTLNAGSSSLKYGLFEIADEGLLEIWRGQIEGPAALDGLIEECEARADGLAAVGHRIVHGGADFTGPQAVSDALLQALEALCPLAPLHQPAGLAVVRAVAAVRPDLVQTVSFDTAFHHGHAAVVDRLALPRAFERAGVRRYGFHGLS